MIVNGENLLPSSTMNTFGFFCAIFWFCVSLVCYIITMGVGWAVAQIDFPGSSTIRAGAIISTIPVVAVVGFIILVGVFGYENVNPCTGLCMVTLVLFAWVFEFIGRMIFIAFGAHQGDARVLAFGVSAGVLGILAGCSCWCSLSACPDGKKKRDHGDGEHSEN